MKILVIGSGGREHALVWRLRRSEGVEQVYCVPGNAGIALEASCVPGDIGSATEMANLAETLGADVTVVGPEAPLVAGLVDEFDTRQLPIVGPSRDAAQLEGSKAFAKRFMQQHGIPTAEFEVVESAADVEKHVSRFGFPVALKADGLAAGKGVVLAKTQAEASEVAQQMLAGELVGRAGKRLVIERCLKGREVSFIVLSDGKSYFAFPPTQDHKPVFDNDEGPNTGGMGAYCDAAIVPKDLEAAIVNNIVEPTLAGVQQLGRPYRGFLYFGLMITAEGPQVLEFNVRMGDPETQSLMYRMTGNFAQLVQSGAKGNLDPSSVGWHAGPTACVVLASEGYPGKYPKGLPITGIDQAEEGGAKVFHAGTLLRQGRLATGGGRVLGVTAGGGNLAEAVRNVYAAVEKVHFEGVHFRRDIAKKALLGQ